MTFISRLLVATLISSGAIDLNLIRRRSREGLAQADLIGEVYGEFEREQQIKKQKKRSVIPFWWAPPKPKHKSRVKHRSTKSMHHRDLDQQKIRRKCTNGNL